ncbi:hypothetical protein TNCV_1597481 [Trichonephila clavipes]|nr:hypothetical protein TNCV_1597481 [Trichonephila clavipes]
MADTSSGVAYKGSKPDLQGALIFSVTPPDTGYCMAVKGRSVADPLIDGEKVKDVLSLLSCSCHDEFCGPLSDYVRQVALATTTTIIVENVIGDIRKCHYLTAYYSSLPVT